MPIQRRRSKVEGRRLRVEGAEFVGRSAVISPEPTNPLRYPVCPSGLWSRGRVSGGLEPSTTRDPRPP